MDHRLTWHHTDRPDQGRRILYWMQASVRVQDNLALAAAVREARNRALPLEVLFCLDAGYPEANARSFAFLLDGLGAAARNLDRVGLALTVVLAPAAQAVPAAGASAAVVVFDAAYLPGPRRLRHEIAQKLPCPVIQAEDNASIPVRTVSEKAEWAAATLRPKLMRLVNLEPPPPQVSEGQAASRPADLAEDLTRAGFRVAQGVPDRSWLALLGADPSVAPTDQAGGEDEARARWERFRDGGLEAYDTARNDPNVEGTSGLAPYLHFGHISPLGLVADLKARGLYREPLNYRQAGEDPVSKFLDEVLVRRELSFNFVVFNPLFDRYEGLAPWARQTLEAHAADRRAYLYDRASWEAGATHDRSWNAAQHQLRSTGHLHGTLRMYWGKKILEWSASPAQAFQDALYLNNRYALDGRDPNSYAGVAWCFGQHDRPWGERAVYGTVRCMVESGLKRKFDLEAYIRRFTPPT